MTTPKMTPLRKAVAIGTLLTLTCGAIYSSLVWAQTYHGQFAQRQEVAQKFDVLQIEVLQSAIRNYEDVLFELDFLIAENSATALDRAKRAKIARRLSDLVRQVAAIRNGA